MKWDLINLIVDITYEIWVSRKFWATLGWMICGDAKRITRKWNFMWRIMFLIEVCYQYFCILLTFAQDRNQRYQPFWLKKKLDIFLLFFANWRVWSSKEHFFPEFSKEHLFFLTDNCFVIILIVVTVITPKSSKYISIY